MYVLAFVFNWFTQIKRLEGYSAGRIPPPRLKKQTFPVTLKWSFVRVLQSCLIIPLCTSRGFFFGELPLESPLIAAFFFFLVQCLCPLLTRPPERFPQNDSVASNWVVGLLVESPHCYLYCLSYLCAITVQKSFKVKALFKATKDCCRFANNDSNVRKKNINNLQIVTIYRQKYVVSHSCQNWLCVVFILSKDIRKTELNCPITLCLGLSKPRWRYAEEASDSARGRKSNKSHD